MTTTAMTTYYSQLNNVVTMHKHRRIINQRNRFINASFCSTTTTNTNCIDDEEREQTYLSSKTITTTTTTSRREHLKVSSSILITAITTSLFSKNLISAYANEVDDDDDLEQQELDALVKTVVAKNSGEQVFVDIDMGIDDAELMSTFKMSSLWKLGNKTLGDTNSGPTNSSTSSSSSSSSPKYPPQTTYDGLVDPVNGTVATKVFVIKTENVNLDSVEGLGKPENVQVYKQLYLDSVDETFKRSDMLLASIRTGEDGIKYYDYDLVASPPPKSCPSAVGCLYPEHIYMISSCIRDNKMFVFVIDATPELWRQTGASIKKLRNSFSVTSKKIASAAVDSFEQQQQQISSISFP
jgi:hypothetical protein